MFPSVITQSEIFGRNLGGSPEAVEEAMKEAWTTYSEGYESLTASEIVEAIDFTVGSSRHANYGLIEVMPTFQMSGGLTFDRREETATA